jgi:cell division protein FtsW
MKAKKPNLTIFSLALGLTIFGIIMVYNASVFEAFQIFSDKYHFLKQQALWAGIGWLALLITTFIPLDLIKKLSPIFLLFSIILLVLVLIPGLSNQSFGARRWINLFGFTLQPTELIKLSLVIYLAAWLDKEKPFWPYLIILGVILSLVMLQPDLGTSIVIILSAVLVYFASGAKIFKLIFLGLLGSLAGAGLILTSTYRKARLMTFFNPSADPLGSSYHIRQALIAIGSGGWWGLGLGQSRQKYQFLPQVTTDSIFAIIVEELGFIGSTLVIVALFLFLFNSLKIAKLASTNFQRLLVIGIVSWIGLQTIINLSAMLSLLPLTGVPLPFISYGGSSLVVTLIGVGLLLNVSRFSTHPNKK